MNRRRRECVLCAKPIAFRVWARYDGGTEPPAPRPQPAWHATESGFDSLAAMVSERGTAQELVCADHVEHFEKGWSRMIGVDPSIIVVGHEPAKPPPALPKGHNVKPEMGWDGKLRYDSSPQWGVFVHCRTVTPESAIGRPVDVFVPPEMVAAMLDVFKQAAIAQRRQTMKEAERQEVAE